MSIPDFEYSDIPEILQAMSRTLERRIKKYKSKKYRDKVIRLLSEVDQSFEEAKRLASCEWGEDWTGK